ncbi:MAG: HNH endonuclease [Dehalococcoidia bacterium]|nr:HNH endonuclease [Dehalococcoidia bacterium]
MSNFADRFWSKVDQNGPIPEHVPSLGPCWVWTASRNKGYGQFNRDGRPVPAHRVSYELAHGPVPDGLFVMHRCDNRACVRPEHLAPGTPAENTADMDNKGRRINVPQVGESHGCARLTEEEVIEIRRRVSTGEKSRLVAADYGVSRETVSAIKTGRLWKHLLRGAEAAA